MADFVLGEKLISAADGGVAFATVDGENVLSSEPGAWTGRRVFWSGWMGDSIFARDCRAWNKEAWERLDRWCDAAASSLARAGASACFRAHPRHVLSDPQSCVSFLKRRAGQPFEVLLDPVSFLTASMLARAEDHMRRALDALAHLGAVPGVVICNARRLSGDDDLLEPSPVGEGVIEPRLLTLMDGSIPAGKARIFVGPNVGHQAALLHGSVWVEASSFRAIGMPTMDKPGATAQRPR